MDNQIIDVMDKDEQEFITALICLAKDMPKERRAPFLWVGKGLTLANSNGIYGNIAKG